LVSIAIIADLFRAGWDGILFPAFAGFMTVSPRSSPWGLGKSYRLAQACLANMIFVKPESGGPVMF